MAHSLFLACLMLLCVMFFSSSLLVVAEPSPSPSSPSSPSVTTTTATATATLSPSEINTETVVPSTEEGVVVAEDDVSLPSSSKDSSSSSAASSSGLGLSTSAYCPGQTPGPISATDSNLGPVDLKGINGVDIHDATNCPGQLGVVDDTFQTAAVSIGGKFVIQYSIDTCGQEHPRTAGAWIDWNQNSVFEPTEEISLQTAATTTQVADLFIVPATALLGITTMRVMVQEVTVPLLDPCATYAFGGAKDFSIKVMGRQALEEGLSGGSIFLIIFFVSAAVYVIGGVVWNKKVRPSDELFPGVSFWLHIPGLCKDGVIFTIAKVTEWINKAKGGSSGNDGYTDEF